MLKFRRSGYFGHCLFVINARLWDSITLVSTFFRDFQFFGCIFLPQCLIIWDFFSLQWTVKFDILTLFWWPSPAVLDPRVSRKSWGLKCLYKMNLWSCIFRRVSGYLSFVSFCLFFYIIGANYLKRIKRLLFVHSKPEEIGSTKLAIPDTETYLLTQSYFQLQVWEIAWFL